MAEYINKTKIVNNIFINATKRLAKMIFVKNKKKKK
jgi:hypothetical protein